MFLLIFFAILMTVAVVFGPLWAILLAVVLIAWIGLAVLKS